MVHKYWLINGVTNKMHDTHDILIVQLYLLLKFLLLTYLSNSSSAGHEVSGIFTFNVWKSTKYREFHNVLRDYKHL